MFDFEKLDVYHKAKNFNKIVYSFLKDNNKRMDRGTVDQLKRASLSIMLNIAEGTSRFSKPDKKNFFSIARGSVFECVAIFDFLKEENCLPLDLFSELYKLSEELSRMLFGMIKALN